MLVRSSEHISDVINSSAVTHFYYDYYSSLRMRFLMSSENNARALRTGPTGKTGGKINLKKKNNY